MTAPRRPVRTYERYGREVYADTGRPVDERLGTHVVLWIVDDPEAWALALEAQGDAEIGLWPKKDRAIAESRRAQRYESAHQVRVNGAGRSWYAVHHNAETAMAVVMDLRRSHPNPGVRYDIAEITDVGACSFCRQPIIRADGQWRHHAGRYPVDCLSGPEATGDEEDSEDRDLLPGEFAIDAHVGSMTCGYCGQTQRWARAGSGLHLTLTGFFCLGVGRDDGELAVLVEATNVSGTIVWLPHPCSQIPQEVMDKYATEITALTTDRATQPNSTSDTSPGPQGALS